MSKHTRGPWKVQDRGHGFSVRNGHLPIAWCSTATSAGASGTYSVTLKEAEANARLIAEAPAMLEALRGVTSHAGFCEEARDLGPCNCPTAAARAILDRLEASDE